MVPKEITFATMLTGLKIVMNKLSLKNWGKGSVDAFLSVVGVANKSVGRI